MSELPPPQVFHHAGTVTRADRAALLGQAGATVWFTGLSGSGKSTLATAVEAALVRAGRAAYVLDGDNVRFGLNASPKILTDTRGYDPAAAGRFGLGFAAADRVENVRRVGEVAKLFADAGLVVLTSFISPYRADRDAARAAHAAAGLPFVEVFVNTPIETCERRDPKGLYRQARATVAAGKAAGFTGIDDPYEPPTAAELTLDTAALSVAEGVAAVLGDLAARGVIPG
ncbi:MAG TPA: adenylyl-sulfate kinase [Urbifossiella sp.]|nr:adenylyl-sulfate kinase [Urbifossiella sp.]